MRKLVMTALVLAGGLLASAPAWATNQYVCSTYYFPPMSPGGTLGTHGYVQSSVYSGPACTGSFVGTYVICSTGATSSLCATAANCGGTFSYLYPEAALNSTAESLQRASNSGQRVGMVTCSGSTIATYEVQFYAN